MTLLENKLPPALLRWELPAVCLLAWIAFISIPISQGGIGLSWDALNHHIYLGWIVGSPRFDRDFLAAAYQSYQFPYLYWPVYKMATSGWSGIWTGIALATLPLLAVPPVWLLARTCIGGATLFDFVMRLLAVSMAFTSAVLLAQFTSTSNDLMAAVPLVWAFALALEPLNLRHPGWLTQQRVVALSGLFAGASVAFKFSNGPLALVVMPALWLLATRGSPTTRFRHTAVACLTTLGGFILVYGYWGSQLWVQFGNPIYPFYDGWFAQLRTLTGWTP